MYEEIDSLETLQNLLDVETMIENFDPRVHYMTEDQYLRIEEGTATYAACGAMIHSGEVWVSLFLLGGMGRAVIPYSEGEIQPVTCEECSKHGEYTMWLLRVTNEE